MTKYQMPRRWQVAAIGLAIGANSLVACGSDNNDAAISKSEFVKKADQICTDANAKINKAAPNPETQSEKDGLAFLTGTMIPSVRQQIKDIRALGFPAGDERTLESTLDQAEAFVDRAAKDTRLITEAKGDPLADVNKRLMAYGLKVCGSNT